MERRNKTRLWSKKNKNIKEIATPISHPRTNRGGAAEASGDVTGNEVRKLTALGTRENDKGGVKKNIRNCWLGKQGGASPVPRGSEEDAPFAGV